jgi:hypothetical protein
MRALVLVLLALSGPVLAQAPDAPAIAITQGTPAPADGVFMPTATAAQLGQGCKQAQAENAELRKALQNPAPVVIAPATGWLITGAVGAVVLGLAVGYVAFHK